jgi:hypothetical protein
MANTTLKFGNGNWAIKDGSALAYSDQYDNYKPLPFDFSRASSATLVNKAGLIESVNSGLPRIDFSHSIDGALLLEPQSTNLIPYSDDFSQSSWVKNGFGNALSPVVTSNSDISPDGNQNASRIEMDCTSTSSSDYSAIYQQLALDGSSEYTISFYVKSNTSSEQDLLFFSNSSFSTQITANSEWQRVESTFTSNSTNTRNFGLLARGSVQQDVDILIWGAQVENRSYATSYIPTNGATSTRVVDFSNGFNLNPQQDGLIPLNSPFTFFSYINTNIGVPSVGNGFYFTENNATAVYYYGTTMMIRSATGEEYASLHSGLHKIAISYDGSSAKLFIDGSKVKDVSASSRFANINNMNFYRNNSNSSFKFNDLRLFNEALTDQYLQELTTI